MEIELTGNKKFDRPVYLLPPDSYEAEITTVSDIFSQKKFKSEEMERKLTIRFKLLGLEKSPIDYLKNESELEKIPEEVGLALYVRLKVTKGGQSGTRTYKNSMMYDIIDGAGLLAGFKKLSEELKKFDIEEEAEKMFLDFLRNNLIGKKVKILVDTVNGQKGEYSVCKKINRFLEGDLKNIE